MTDEDDGSDSRSSAIRGAIVPESDSQEQSQTESQTVEQTQSQSESQSQTQSVMESLGIDTDEEDLKESRKHVNMYLDEELAKALDERFNEIKALHKKQKGYEIEKNRDFYPAMIEAAFNDNKNVLGALGLNVEN